MISHFESIKIRVVYKIQSDIRSIIRNKTNEDIFKVGEVHDKVWSVVKFHMQWKNPLIDEFIPPYLQYILNDDFN